MDGTATAREALQAHMLWDHLLLVAKAHLLLDFCCVAVRLHVVILQRRQGGSASFLRHRGAKCLSQVCTGQ